MAVVASHDHELVFFGHALLSVGYQHVLATVRPPYGIVLSCSEDIMFVRQVSRHSVGTVTRFRSRTKAVASRPICATRSALATWGNVVGFHPGQRRPPILAESHLTRLFFHLTLTPGKLALPDGDQLVGRVGEVLETDLGGHGLGADRSACQRIVRLALLSSYLFAKVLCVLFDLLSRVVVRFLHPPVELGRKAARLLGPAVQGVYKPSDGVGRV